MVSEFSYALGLTAPFYNLVLAAISFFIFVRMFRLPNRLVYLKPWKVLFAAFCVYLVEEFFTTLKKLELATLPGFVNALFEMAIISLFIYMLFLQKEHVKQFYIIKRKYSPSNLKQKRASVTATTTKKKTPKKRKSAKKKTVKKSSKKKK